jgi:hypothetical protein
MGHTISSPTDSGLLGKLLKGVYGTVKRGVTGGFAADAVALPPIDYRRFTKGELLRFKKVGPAPLALPPRRAAGRAAALR